MAAESENIEKLKKKFKKSVIDSHSFRGDDTVIVKKNGVLDICRFLKEDKDLAFNFMMDLTVVDYLNQKEHNERFEVVYHFYSSIHNHRLRLRAPVSEGDCTIDSIVSVWKGANWFEREAYDMYGIKFNNHPDLRRILLYEEFEGYPLRKDYPIKKRQPLIGPLN
tara:strand:+ start:562 stop:1056 length:495 start_codon:yes stop_codon:yes gene_type:complete